MTYALNTMRALAAVALALLLTAILDLAMGHQAHASGNNCTLPSGLCQASIFTGGRSLVLSGTPFNMANTTGNDLIINGGTAKTPAVVFYNGNNSNYYLDSEAGNLNFGFKWAEAGEVRGLCSMTSAGAFTCASVVTGNGGLAGPTLNISTTASIGSTLGVGPINMNGSLTEVGSSTMTIKGGVTPSGTGVQVKVTGPSSCNAGDLQLDVQDGNNGDLLKVPCNAAAIGVFGLDANSQKGTHFADPTVSTDAATKNYVDTHVSANGVSGFLPSGVTSATDEILNCFTPSRTWTFGRFNQSVYVDGASGGGGVYNLELIDHDNADSRVCISGNINCSGVAGTFGVFPVCAQGSGVATAGHRICLRYDHSTCTTAPVLNANAQGTE